MKPTVHQKKTKETRLHHSRHNYFLFPANQRSDRNSITFVGRLCRRRFHALASHIHPRITLCAKRIETGNCLDMLKLGGVNRKLTQSYIYSSHVSPMYIMHIMFWIISMYQLPNLFKSLLVPFHGY